MNIIKKNILNYAKKIEARDEAKRKAKFLDSGKAWEERKQIRIEAKKIINDYLESLASKMDTSRFSEGEKVILNVYNLIYKGSNSWDGGTNSFKRCLEDEDRKKVLYFTVKKTHVDFSLASERLTNYLDNVNDHLLNLMVKDPQSLVSDFTRIQRNRRPDARLEEALELYVGVYFEPLDVKFKPAWSLNQDSFLKANSKEGKLTASIWKRELRIHKRREEYYEKLSQLDEEKRIIESEYKGITYR